MQREAIEQEAIVQYCAWHGIEMFAIPNGGSRDAKEAYYLKRSGVKPGVPDMFFPGARHGYHGLFIELKAENGRLSTAQREWLAKLFDMGYCTRVCYGRDAAIAAIDWYFGEEE